MFWRGHPTSMLEHILHNLQSIKIGISSLFLSLAVVTGTPLPAPIVIENYHEIPVGILPAQVAPAPILGANISSVADFSTSLASGIDNATTTMSLVSSSSGSDTLVVGETYGFKLGGREYVLGTASTNNRVINMTRGLSRRTATTTFASYKQAWGRGTSVEITDAPLILDIGNKITGKAGFDATLKYAQNFSFATDTELVSKKYVDDTAFSGAGVVDSSVTARGVSELATQIETASSTASGGSGILVIPATNATSTYNSATAALRVVVTKNNGKIDSNFLENVALTNTVNTWTASNVFATSTTATTTIGSFPAWEIGKHRKVITSTGTSTFAIPSGITRLHVRVVGGGGGGGNATCSGANQTCGSPGGGAGGYVEGMVNVSATTSVQVFVGSGGAGSSGSGGGSGQWSTFGTNGYFLSASGGAGASDTEGGAGGAGGVGLVGAGGDSTSSFIVTGEEGGYGTVIQTSTGPGTGGEGGSSVFGGGGASCRGTAPIGGLTATTYGSGGGGACGSQSGGAANGGTAYQGIVIITW